MNEYTVAKKGLQYVTQSPLGIICAWFGSDVEAAKDDAFLRNVARQLRIKRRKKPDDAKCISPRHCGPDQGA